MVTVRTRIAPSPTGDPHVGLAYVALVNYCFARKANGAFILRIEDTDQTRSTHASEQAILEALHWLGLQWDEGPDVGGPHGPYRQTERSALYQKYAQQLLDQGDAFKCFCSPERLEAVRNAQRAAKQPTHYDGHCLDLSAQEVAAKEKAGEPYVIRMNVPSAGVCIVKDLRRDPIEIEWPTVDMQVLLKSDGMPTYHLANVVDDHLMEITHVIRGEEWLSSAPKHLLLYRYFGWPAPQLLHLPLLRNPDHSKLSKRKNPTGILFYKAMGYLPEALLNFLGLLAVPTPEGEEMMDLPTMVGRFDIAHISLGGPVFDIPKLDWLNGRYLRERLDLNGFEERVQRWGFDSDRLRRIATLAQPRIARLSDLGPLLSFFFAGRLSLTPELIRDGKLDEETLRKVLAIARWNLDDIGDWNITTIETALRSVAAILGRKFRDIVRPLYVAVTGSAESVPLYDSIELLGRDLTRERLRHALQLIGTPSAAEEKAWRALSAPATPAGVG
ncbi:MAG: glutamate--tRNA ligase [Candidatus Eremiobacteraeota bacterium]|nr:glutamate--tRNA ligase [Candidatus Eremiobacteraeota bacterium]